MTKKLEWTLDDFARILLIYALHESYDNQRLSHWGPELAAGEMTLPSRPIWLPSLPVYKRWQNLTCDRLDILHWTANARIGEACGFEHPTLLHLHLARVVLLAPVHEIVKLAKHLTGAKGAKSEADIVADRHAIQRWAY
jgi:hypothetical protein